MRTIAALDSTIRNLAFSQDGRFFAAACDRQLAVFSQDAGERTSDNHSISNCSQLAFTPRGDGVVYASDPGSALCVAPSVASKPSVKVAAVRGVPFAGGIAVSPDGKTLAAVRAGLPRHAKLERLSIPDWGPLSGFDFWSPFQRLAFSPNGEFLAGIGRDCFELRIAVTGGLNGRKMAVANRTSSGFLTFPRSGEFVAFGWASELYVVETRAGNPVSEIRSPAAPFVDAAFIGSGRLLATVDGTETMRIWSMETMKVATECNWMSGRLTCLAVSADGLTGICGTSTGRLIAFDVDE